MKGSERQWKVQERQRRSPPKPPAGSRLTFAAAVRISRHPLRFDGHCASGKGEEARQTHHTAASTRGTRGGGRVMVRQLVQQRHNPHLRPRRLLLRLRELNPPESARALEVRKAKAVS